MQPCGEYHGYGPEKCWRGSGCGVVSGPPLPLHVGGCRELGQVAAAPTSPVVRAAELLLVLLGTAGAAVGRTGAMQDVGQQWAAVPQPGGGQSQRVSASPAPPPGHGTDRPVCVHPLPAPALTHSHCCGQVSAQGQHIKDTALLFTTLSPLPKTPLGAPHLCRP